MKIIDLLNKIANGEDVPEKIKYEEEIFERVISGMNINDYLDEDGDYLFQEYDWLQNINDEVEIIEDKPEPKPITKKDLEALGYAFGEMRKALQNGWNKSLNNEPFKEDKKIEKIDVNHLQTIKKWKRAKILGNKINEIIDYINKGDN